MSGGYGNIKPEDGIQFSKDYQPAEKWTEERALEIGEELIKWMRNKKSNIFFNDFLLIKKGYNYSLISYLAKKFTSFSKLLAQAKEIQKTKLIKHGVFDELNPTMTKFVLINNHGMHNKTETDITTKGESLNADLSKLSTDELIKRAEAMSKIEQSKK